jgi:hypothetical protein
MKSTNKTCSRCLKKYPELFARQEFGGQTKANAHPADPRRENPKPMCCSQKQPKTLTRQTPTSFSTGTTSRRSIQTHDTESRGSTSQLTYSMLSKIKHPLVPNLNQPKDNLSRAPRLSFPQGKEVSFLLFAKEIGLLHIEL